MQIAVDSYDSPSRDCSSHELDLLLLERNRNSLPVEIRNLFLIE
jgi:hypothetical protein